MSEAEAADSIVCFWKLMISISEGSILPGESPMGTAARLWVFS